MKVRIIENKLTDIKAKIIDLKADIYEKYHVTTNLTYDGDDLSIEHIENENMENNINGYRAMVDILTFVDTYKMPVGLIASEFYGSPIDKLRKFYEGFGFVTTHIYEPGVELMQRKPKTINKVIEHKELPPIEMGSQKSKLARATNEYEFPSIMTRIREIAEKNPLQFYDYNPINKRYDILNIPKEIYIYRFGKKIEPGDFVGIKMGVAKFYSTQISTGKIIKKKVPIEDLLISPLGNLEEFIYAPKNYGGHDKTINKIMRNK